MQVKVNLPQFTICDGLVEITKSSDLEYRVSFGADNEEITSLCYFDVIEFKEITIVFTTALKDKYDGLVN